MWKYSNSDDNGGPLVCWSKVQNTYLVFDAKERCIFISAAWGTEHNPDLNFPARYINDKPLPVFRSVNFYFSHNQHRRGLINIGISIPIIKWFKGITYPDRISERLTQSLKTS